MAPFPPEPIEAQDVRTAFTMNRIEGGLSSLLRNHLLLCFLGRKRLIVGRAGAAHDPSGADEPREVVSGAIEVKGRFRSRGKNRTRPEFRL